MNHRLLAAVAAAATLAAALIQPARAQAPRAYKTERVGSPTVYTEIQGIADSGYIAGSERGDNGATTLLLGTTDNLVRIPFPDQASATSLRPNTAGKVAFSRYDTTASMFRTYVAAPNGTVSPVIAADPTWGVSATAIDDNGLIAANIYPTVCATAPNCGNLIGLIDAATGATTLLPGGGDQAVVTTHANNWTGGVVLTGNMWQPTAWEDNGTAHPMGPASDITIPGARLTLPLDINSSGMTVGYTIQQPGPGQNATDSLRGFYWTPTSTDITILDKGNRQASLAFGVANSGVIAGATLDYDPNTGNATLVDPALWEGTTRYDYPIQGCAALFFDINSSYDGVGETLISNTPDNWLYNGLKFSPARTRLTSTLLNLTHGCDGNFTLREPLRLLLGRQLINGPLTRIRDLLTR